MTAQARKWARVAEAALAGCGNERVAAQARTYFKPHEQVSFYGVKTAEVRRIEREIFRQVSSIWGIEDAISFCGLLIQSKFLEAKGVGILLVSRYRREFGPDLLGTVVRWLAKGYCGNWSTTDGLSTAVIAPLLLKFPNKLKVLKTWTRADTLWLRRAAAVSLTPLSRKGVHLDVAYELAELLLREEEDLMHKAVGWLLREAGKTDPERLELFLLAHGPQLPRTALRYAIERFPAEKRAAILRQTRAATV